jgi:hypothetical protein
MTISTSPRFRRLDEDLVAGRERVGADGVDARRGHVEGDVDAGARDFLVVHRRELRAARRRAQVVHASNGQTRGAPRVAVVDVYRELHRPGQRPLKFGVRFSMNAVRPSL